MPGGRPIGTTEHLLLNRGLILERAAVAGAVGMVPIPLVDDLLAGAARSELLRRIAAIRGVGVEEVAVTILAQIDGGAGATARLATRRTLRRSFRRLALALHAFLHAGDFATTFAVATLFDHYCARHHVGAALDANAARKLRVAIHAAIADARAGIARRGARRALQSARQLLLAAPRVALARLPAKAQAQAEPGPLPPERVDPAAPRTAVRGNVLQRGFRSLTGLLGDGGQGWVTELVAAFDGRWEAAR